MQALSEFGRMDLYQNIYTRYEIFDKYLTTEYLPTLCGVLLEVVFDLRPFSIELLMEKICEVFEQNFKKISGLDEVFSFLEFLFKLNGKSELNSELKAKIITFIFRAFISFQNDAICPPTEWDYLFKRLSQHVSFSSDEEKTAWFNLIGSELKEQKNHSPEDYEVGKKALIAFFACACKQESPLEETRDRLYLNMTRLILIDLNNTDIVKKEISYLLNHPKREDHDIRLILSAFEKHAFSTFQRYAEMKKYLIFLSRINSNLPTPDEMFLLICEHLFKKSLADSHVYAADFMALVSVLMLFPEIAKTQICYQSYVKKVHEILEKKVMQCDSNHLESIRQIRRELFGREPQEKDRKELGSKVYGNFQKKINFMTQMFNLFGRSDELNQNGFSIICLYFKHFVMGLNKGGIKKVFFLISKSYRIQGVSEFNKKLILQIVLDLCLSKRFRKYAIDFCKVFKQCFCIDQAWLGEIKMLCQATPSLAIEKNLGFLITLIPTLCVPSNSDGRSSVKEIRKQIKIEAAKFLIPCLNDPKKIIQILQKSIQNGDTFKAFIKIILFIMDHPSHSRAFQFNLGSTILDRALSEKYYKYGDFCELLKILGRTVEHFEGSMNALSKILCKPFYFSNIKHVSKLFEENGALKSLESFWVLTRPFTEILQENRDAVASKIYYNWMTACGEGSALNVLVGIWRMKVRASGYDKRTFALLNEQIFGQMNFYKTRLLEIMQICHENIQELDNDQIRKQADIHLMKLSQGLEIIAKKICE
ncbi:putative uncharacterized protein [Parachlamydia acanthamoebae UV-7]|uniref:Uncharacterized protein n=2 Tax=Parachlamydia acanthamoebae TaxID=83552 RepID=F8L0Y8_PARAV|nr:hypothetical protein [Parachlamydia acanthamoebae]EFB42626.1 hypothetical protein pah_c004o146 [Parachlamydia acanthamoebae str. Hall's coccus]CCB86903.1 putative uncharacterized protein [Parachlamydia acanthamoebae UV-7]